MRGSAGRSDVGGAAAGRGVRRRPVAILLLAVLTAVIATAAAAWSGGAIAAPAGGKIVAVGAESEYANVIGQVGGKYVPSGGRCPALYRARPQARHKRRRPHG